MKLNELKRRKLYNNQMKSLTFFRFFDLCILNKHFFISKKGLSAKNILLEKMS